MAMTQAIHAIIISGLRKLVAFAGRRFVCNAIVTLES